MKTLNIPKPRVKNYLPEEFKISVWSKLRPYYSELENREISSVEDLKTWIKDKNELAAIVSEEYAWRYIKISIDTTDSTATDLYQYFVQELSPKIAKFDDKLNKKLINSNIKQLLDKDLYFIYFREIENDLSLYRDENIPLFTKQNLRAKAYSDTFSQITIQINNKSLTYPQAIALLEKPDRNFREDVYRKSNNELLLQKEEFNSIFNDLMKLRHQIATNAGFENYRDFKFKHLGRFDYAIDDCFDFHESIANEIVPLIEELDLVRKNDLNVDKLRPWDMKVDAMGLSALKPFNGEKELVTKAINVLESIDPFFGECIQVMQKLEHLDLESRKGKRPGGYNMPLLFTGIPFIFMNSTNTVRDMRTLMHEAGHAIHSFLTRDYSLNLSKNPPSEVAELASMTMELLSIDYWDVFFPNESDLKRAKLQQLETSLRTLPWVATIDKFQHWVYTNPKHTIIQREQEWLKISSEFESKIIDKSGLEKYYKNHWHKQLHLFEVPFYYIEYGMAQLGAIAIWKNYKENPQKTLSDFKDALKLGYTKTIGEIYKTAGIKFDFSREYVAELSAFIKNEMEKLIFE